MEYEKLKSLLSKIEYAHGHEDHQIMMEATTALQETVPDQFRLNFAREVIVYKQENGGLKYYVRKRGKIKAAHLWDGKDTVCRMASTGGLNPKRYDIVSEKPAEPICQNCLRNFRILQKNA